MRTRIVLSFCSLLVACSGNPDDSRNVLPMHDALPPDVAVADAHAGDAATGDGGPASPFPATYRFGCIHIEKLGEPSGSGELPAQANVLNGLWRNDINHYRLNILIGVEAFDAMTGQATAFIGSGVGLDAASQCREATTDGVRFPAQLETGDATLVPVTTAGHTECVADAPAGTAALGRLDVTVPGESPVYIYAQNEKGVYFNCTPDEALPNAVPLRQVRAQVSFDASAGRIAGRLTACLTQADIGSLCSCIGNCAARDLSDLTTDGPCAGCPRGAAPLTAQLAGLTPSPDCTQRNGGTAYELTAAFYADRLPDVPAVCQ